MKSEKVITKDVCTSVITGQTSADLGMYVNQHLIQNLHTYIKCSLKLHKRHD